MFVNGHLDPMFKRPLGRYKSAKQIASYKTEWARKRPEKRRVLVRRKVLVTATVITGIPCNPVFRIKLHLICHGNSGRDAAYRRGIRFAKQHLLTGKFARERRLSLIRRRLQELALQSHPLQELVL